MLLHLRIIRIMPSLFFLLLVVSAAAVQAEPRVMNIDHPHQLPMTGFASDFAVIGDVDGDSMPCL